MIPVPRCVLKINEHKVKPVEMHKYLGVILDQELHFKSHAAYAIRKGTRTALQVCRLVQTKTKREVAGKYL